MSLLYYNCSDSFNEENKIRIFKFENRLDSLIFNSIAACNWIFRSIFVEK